MLPIGSSNGNKQNQNRKNNVNYNSITPTYNQRPHHQRQLTTAQQVVAAHSLTQHQLSDNQQTSNITASQQMNYYNELQRLQVAQANQMSQTAHDNHGNPHQAASVLRTHTGFQQNIHPLGSSQLNTASIHTPSTSSHRSNSNVLQARNMNESKPAIQSTSLDANIVAIITEINAGGQDTVESLTEKIASSLKPFEVSQELAIEKKTLSDSLEVIEKDRKHSDYQVDNLVRRVDRFKQRKDEDKDNDEDENENAIDSEPVWLKITKENRQIASHMADKSHVPIKSAKPNYVEPRDAPGMRTLMEKHRAFRPQLIKYLTTLKQEEERVLQLHSEVYTNRLKTWKDKLKKWEDSSKKRTRDEKHRAIFENTFPDIKKAREDKERTGRGERTSRIIGTEFMSIAQKDVDEKKMRNAVAVPPHLHKLGDFRKEDYFNNMHLDIKDASLDNRTMIEDFQSTWTTAEESMFSSRYREAGKNFSYIAEFLPDKIISECVLYYYLAKARCNFKAMYRKKRKGGKVYKPMVMPTKEEVEMYRLNRPLAHNDQGVPTKQELRCCKCQQILDCNQLHGRSARDASDMYVVYSNKTHEPAICHKCRETVHKDVYSSRCLIKTCTSKKGTKASKYIPPSFMTLGEIQRAFLHDKLGIPHELFKLCGPCLKELNRRTDMVIKGECEEQITAFEYQSGLVWSTDESMRLASHFSQIGADYEKIAARMPTRSAEECRLHLEAMRENGEVSVPVIIEIDDEDTQMGEVSDDLHSVDDANEDVPMNDNSVETIEDISNTPPSENMGSVEPVTPVMLNEIDETQIKVEPSVSDTSLNPASVPTFAPTPSRESFGSASDFAVRVGGSGGSITAGTPIRPPSISVVEHLSAANKPMSSVSQQFLTSASRSTSNRGTPQPPAVPTPQLQPQQNTAFQPLQHPVYQRSNQDITAAYFQKLAPAAPAADLGQLQWLEISKHFANVDDTELKRCMDTAPEEGTRLLMRALLEQRRKEREAAQQKEQQRQRDEQQQRDAAVANQYRQQLQHILQQQLGGATTSQAHLQALAAYSRAAGVDLQTMINNLLQPGLQNAPREPEPQPIERVNNEVPAAQGQTQNVKQETGKQMVDSLATRLAEVENLIQENETRYKNSEEKRLGLMVNLQALEQKFSQTAYATNSLENEPQWAMQRKQVEQELQVCQHLSQTFKKQIEDSYMRREQIHRELNSVGIVTPHSSGLPTPSGSFSIPQFSGNNAANGTNQLASAAILQQHMASAFGVNKAQSSSPLQSYTGMTADRNQTASLHANQQSQMIRGNIKGMTERSYNDETNLQQAQQQQQHSVNHGQADVMKRKSGIETVMKLSSVQPASRHQLAVPHMRRPPSPNTSTQSYQHSINQPLSLNTSMDPAAYNSQLKSPRMGVSSMGGIPGGAFRASSSTMPSQHQLPSQLSSQIPTTGSGTTLDMYLRQQTVQQHQQSYELLHQKMREDQERERRKQRDKEMKEREERQRKEQEEKIRREEERKKQEERERSLLLERQRELQRQQQAQQQQLFQYELYRQLLPTSSMQMSMPNTIGARGLTPAQPQPGTSVISSVLPQAGSQILNQNIFHQLQPTVDGGVQLQQQPASIPAFSQPVSVEQTIGLTLPPTMPSTSMANKPASSAVITLDDLSDISDDETPPGHTAAATSISVSNNDASASDQLYTLLDFAPDDVSVSSVAAPQSIPRMPFLPPADPNAVSVNLCDTFECVSDDDAG